MTATPLYAGILGFWMVILSARVILARREAKVSLGHDGNTMLERRIRAQANFAEYAPLGLILMAILELSAFSIYAVHALGVLLVSGRLLHGWALSFTESSAIGRTGGAALTLAAIGFGAVFCILRVL